VGCILADFGIVSTVAKRITMQKQRAKRLIFGGAIFIAFVVSFLSYTVVRVPGFSEVLPAEETVALVEFPVAAVPELVVRIEDTLKISWENEIKPWAGQRAAVAFLKTQRRDEAENSAPYPLNPLLLIQVQSVENALKFAQTFRNTSGRFEQIVINGVTAFSTPNTHFVFLSDNLVFAPTRQDLELIVEQQTGFEKLLSRDRDFAKIQKNIHGEYRAFFRPEGIARSAALPFINSFLTRAAVFVPEYKAVGIGANAIKITQLPENTKPQQPAATIWRGESYALLAQEFEEFEKTPYRAELLPLLPPEPEFLVTGQNLARHIIQGGEQARTVVKQFGESYFPSIDLSAIAPKFFSGEFAYAEDTSRPADRWGASKKVFVVQTAGDITKEVSALREAFSNAASQRTTKRRAVTLPDGSEAFELVPNPDGVSASRSTYRDIPIYEVTYGNNDKFYDAATEDLWIASNNLIALQEILSRKFTQEESRRTPSEQPRPGFLGSEAYKNFLQPILKNPDFIGYSKKDGFGFGISKRTFSEHMEASFIFR